MDNKIKYIIGILSIVALLGLAGCGQNATGAQVKPYSERVGGIKLTGTKLTAIEKEMEITNDYQCSDYAAKTSHVYVGKFYWNDIAYANAYRNSKKQTYVLCDIDAQQTKAVAVMDYYIYEAVKDMSNGDVIIK